MSICFAMVMVSVRSIVWVAVAVSVGCILVLLQRRLRIFTRGTIAFMTLVVLVTTAIAVLERAHAVRNAENRTRRMAERYTALKSIDTWCQDTFDVHDRITGGSTALDTEVAENFRVHAAALRQRLEQRYPNKLITTHCIAIDLKKFPSRFFSPFGVNGHKWDFTIVVDVKVAGRPTHPPNVIIKGAVRTYSVQDDRWTTKSFAIHKSNLNSSPADTAKQFLDSEFQSSAYSAHNVLPSKNRYGAQRVRYEWKQ